MGVIRSEGKKNPLQIGTWLRSVSVDYFNEESSLSVIFFLFLRFAKFELSYFLAFFSTFSSICIPSGKQVVEKGTNQVVAEIRSAWFISSNDAFFSREIVPFRWTFPVKR